MAKIEFLTVQNLMELEGLSKEAIIKRLRRNYYAGAQKVDPTKQTSAWVIPVSSYQATKEPITQKTKNRARPSRAAKARP